MASSALEEAQDQTVYNPVHISLQRRNMLLGCETEPLVCIFGLVAFLTVVAPRPLTFILGIVILVGALYILRKLGKRDPYMISVLMRHFRYQSEYPAWPALGTRPVILPKEQR